MTSQWYHDNKERILAQRREPNSSKKQWQNRHWAEIHAYLRETKAGSPCTDCGETYPHYVMDFDHVPGRGQKRFGLQNAGRYSMATVLAEIAKCDLVCSNCHRARTYLRANDSDTEGSDLKQRDLKESGHVEPLIEDPETGIRIGVRRPR